MNVGTPQASLCLTGLFCSLLLFASPGMPQSNRGAGGMAGQLPTGVHLDSAGELINLGNMPQAFAVVPGTNKLVVRLSGWREQGIQVVDLNTKQVTQTLSQGAAFVGLVFSLDGRILYVSGDDSIYGYAWDGSSLSLQRKIHLSEKHPAKLGTRFPAGLAISPDGKQLYVAENVAHSVAVIDLSTSAVVQRLPTDHYPYAVVASTSGEVYVSA